MAKKAQNRDQMEAKYIREIMEEVAAIHKDLLPLWKRVQRVSHKLLHFEGKRHGLYSNILESIRRRLYFGSDFYPYFMSVELWRMYNELNTIRETIEAVMVEDEKGGKE